MQDGTVSTPRMQLPPKNGHDFQSAADTPTAPLSVTGIDIQVPYSFCSADNLATPYTNYTSGYKALLDYVWYEPRVLSVTRQLPVPPPELLASYIPSPAFPSDHLAVVYDLMFKPQLQQRQQQQQLESQHTQEQDQQQQQQQHGQGVLHPAVPEQVSAAVQFLQRGEVVALPTDTLYGLAAHVTNPTAIQRLRTVKSRAHDVPLAICVADLCDVSRYCHTEHLPAGLLPAVLPGPITVLLPLKEGTGLPAELLPAAAPTVQQVSVGVRVPQSAFIRSVCRQLGGPLALTSANVSGQPSTLEVHEFRCGNGCISTAAQCTWPLS